MTKQEFLNLLKLDGYPDPVLVEQPANGRVDNHVHEFAVKALIVDGMIEIETEGKKSSYVLGDMFALKLNQPHKENYGPEGVKYLASRKSAPLT